MIETATLSLFMVVLSVVEFKHGQDTSVEPAYTKVGSGVDDAKKDKYGVDDDDMEKKLRH